MRLFLLIIFNLLILNAFAAKGEIEIRTSPYDFGKVYNWDNPPAIFEIINKSEQNLRFLPTFPSLNFKVNLPQKELAPGQSAMVEVYYYTKEMGVFSEKVDIYTGNSAKAIELKIKGEIMSMSPNAFTACPTINKEKPASQKFHQEVVIIDAKTREPIPNAELKWFYNNRNNYKSKSDRNGKVVEEIELGRYSLLASSNGYEPNTANGLITRGTGLIVIPLNPIIKTSYGTYEVHKNAKPKKDPAEGGIYYPVSKSKEKPKPVQKTEESTVKANSSPSKLGETAPASNYKPSIPANTDTEENKEEVVAEYDAYKDENRPFKSDNSKASINVPDIELEDKPPVNTIADFSDIRAKEVEMEFYENKKENNADSEIAADYRARIAALKEADAADAWESPFDNKDWEQDLNSDLAEKENTEVAAKETLPVENAAGPELQFYNRNSPVEAESSIASAAYEAYLEEIRQLELKLAAGQKKPSFFPDDLEQSDIVETDFAKAEADERETARSTSPAIVAKTNNSISQPSPDAELDPAMYAANNVLFLLDVSTSMKGEDRIGLLKFAMNNLIEIMRDFDYLTIMTYSSETNVVLDRTRVENKSELKEIINGLEASGWTFGLKGLNNAFDIINNNYISEGNNQIIISTDGVFNNPKFTEKDLYTMVRDNGAGTKLSVIGFGDDKEALKRMRRLAKVGSGNFIHIANKREASGALVNEIKAQSLLE